MSFLSSSIASHEIIFHWRLWLRRLLLLCAHCWDCIVKVCPWSLALAHHMKSVFCCHSKGGLGAILTYCILGAECGICLRRIFSICCASRGLRKILWVLCLILKMVPENCLLLFLRVLSWVYFFWWRT